MDWSYVAGFFDGEGTVGFQKHCASVIIQVPNTNKEVIMSILMFLKQQGLHPYYSTSQPKEKNRKRYFVCGLGQHEEVLIFAKAIIEFVIIKKDKLQKAIEHIENHDWWSVPLEKLKIPELDGEKLMELYWKKNLSQREIANKYGVSQCLVSFRMKRFNIPSRSFSEAQLLVWGKK